MAGGSGVTLGAVARDIKSYHELLFQFVRRDISIRYRQAVMGFGWAILLPILTMGASLVLRAVAFKNGGADAPPVSALAVKAWAWGFVAGGLTFGSQSLLSNIQLVTKIYFPREVLPMAAVLTQCFDALIGLVVVAIALPILHAEFGWAALWAPLLLVLLALLVLGLSLFLAAANIFFRDVKYIVQVFLTFGIFFTPVVYDPSSFHGFARALVMANPFAGLLVGLDLTLTRNIGLGTTHATATGILWQPTDLIAPVVGTFAMLFIGVSVFRRGAAWFAEVW
jgi:ABC-type polysaccharide/polyol phosphate export permease